MKSFKVWDQSGHFVGFYHGYDNADEVRDSVSRMRGVYTSCRVVEFKL